MGKSNSKTSIVTQTVWWIGWIVRLTHNENFTFYGAYEHQLSLNVNVKKKKKSSLKLIMMV